MSPLPRRLVVMSGARILGGAELSLVALAARLPEHGWDVVLTCPPGPLADAAAERKIAALPRPWRPVKIISSKVGDAKHYSPAAVAESTWATAMNGVRLAALLRATRASAVLSNSLPTHLAVALAGRLARIPALWYLREIVDPGPGRRVLEAAGSSAAALLSISRAVTASISHPRIITVPEPIEAPPLPTGSDRNASRPVVGYIGRLDPRKGVEDVCRAAATVDADFVIAGAPLLADQSYVKELKALAERSAPGRVKFVGPVPSPWDFLASLDVLVVPSRREPWGRVAAESLISGVPVIAANTGGLPEIVRDGVDGYLYPPGDVSALAEKLRRLLSDDDLRNRLGHAGREGAGRFAPETHVEQVVRAIDEVVSGARRSAA